jgi:hypothetical protein
MSIVLSGLGLFPNAQNQPFIARGVSCGERRLPQSGSILASASTL